MKYSIRTQKAAVDAVINMLRRGMLGPKSELAHHADVLGSVIDFMEATAEEESSLSDRLREILDYDSETGVFTWKKRADKPKEWNTRWSGKIAGSIHRASGYGYIEIDYVMYRSHRLAWLHSYARWPCSFIDHINGDRSDNRICNLREANNSKNQMNAKRRKDNTSGFKGVHWDASRRAWMARINIDGKPKQLGRFARFEDACEAREKAAREVHGEFFRAS